MEDARRASRMVGIAIGASIALRKRRLGTGNCEAAHFRIRFVMIAWALTMQAFVRC